jgi:hypothetical protein
MVGHGPYARCESPRMLGLRAVRPPANSSLTREAPRSQVSAHDGQWRGDAYGPAQMMSNTTTRRSWIK